MRDRFLMAARRWEPRRILSAKGAEKGGGDPHFADFLRNDVFFWRYEGACDLQFYGQLARRDDARSVDSGLFGWQDAKVDALRRGTSQG